MTSWVLAIDDSYASHWDIAKSHGFWDLTKSSPIAEGDLVYFWVAKGSLRAQTLVTKGISPLADGDVPPWEDSGIRSYTHRFEFDVLTDEPLGSPTWKEVAAAAGLTTSLNFRPHTNDPAGEAALASYFEVDTSNDEYDRGLEVLRLTFEEATTDARVLVEKLVVLRQGQPKFRNELLAAYGGACAVTGTKVEAVLEAAHIAPHKGTHTNVVYNGLLLRADVHTLFDLHLLAITDDLIVHTSPALAGSPYEDLEGRKLTRPSAKHQWPSRELLEAHRQDCSWIASSPHLA